MNAQPSLNLRLLTYLEPMSEKIFLTLSDICFEDSSLTAAMITDPLGKLLKSLASLAEAYESPYKS